MSLQMHATHMISVFVIALFLYPSSAVPSSSFAVPSSSLPGDGIVLISIKATIYDPDDRLDSWTTSDPTTYCSWTGVGCDNVGRVVTLDFSNMGLSGPFLNQVTNLSALRLLNVSYNLIESLPSDISKLKNLDVLDLYYNALSGELPLDLCNLEKLRLLNVSFNGFNGSLPSDISKLKNLEVLDVSYNDLSGALPLDLSYLEKLGLLNVSYNGFNGSLPSDISKLNNLEVLDFSYNEFIGSLPSDISKLKNLEVLDVFHNALSGALPLDLSYLVNLRHLDLGGNSFSGSIPGEFGKLKNVEYLSLSGNSLSGRIPGELGNLGNLKILKLGNIDEHIDFNKFDGGIPQEIGNLRKLVHLDMDRCGLSGEIPSELGCLKNLETMSLQGNGLTGEISFIGDLQRLEVLRLAQNNFQGPLPQQLGVSGQLLEVDVSFNRLTGSISPTLCKAGRLQILSVANNSFIGPIPGFLGTCNSLVEVHMGKNNFSGSIRADLLYLPKLTVIELDSNYLSGTIKEKINNVSSMLLIMDISDNCLSGSLPSSIGKLSALQQLLISSNQLTGNVPPEIGNCIALRSVDLSRNKFTGPIPAEISKISNLSYLNVSRNHLNESIPTEVQNMIKNLNILDFSYNDFSGILQVNSEFSLWDPSYYVGNPHLRVSYVSGSRHQAPLKRGLLLALGPLIFCSLVLPIWAVIRKSRIAKKEGDARSWEMTIFQKLDFGSNDIVGCIKKDNVIGKGGAGIVYRGIMPNGQQIAVKKLTRIGIGSSNDYGFSAEIQTVGKIRHRHIATLLAFCSNHDTNLLVYEYMTNGSLGELLHGNNGGHLQWDTRYRIAIEVAKGLCYLHHDCSPLILHRDVKSNNILLDSKFEAHVADFGLAKLLHHSATPECISSIAGSFGYIAPEYAYTLKVDEKSDVYSYGVVLLELITGKRAVEELEFEEGMNIAGWVKKMTNFDRRVVMKIVDPKLSTFSMEEAMHILFVALLCIQEQPVHRPSMREIVYILTHCKPTP